MHSLADCENLSYQMLHKYFIPFFNPMIYSYFLYFTTLNGCSWLYGLTQLVLMRAKDQKLIMHVTTML